MRQTRERALSPTTEIVLRNLPPDERAVHLSALRTAGGSQAVVRILCSTLPHDAPTALLLNDRALTFASQTRTNDPLRDAIGEDVYAVVCLLGSWDAAIAEAQLLSIHPYLAGAIGLDALQALCLERPVKTARALDELAALELIYRFPLPMRFRGAYTGEEQFRLNGWGRRLFRRLASAPDADLDSWLRATQECVAEHRHQYAHHFALLVSPSATPAERWASTVTLPVPTVM